MEVIFSMLEENSGTPSQCNQAYLRALLRPLDPPLRRLRLVGISFFARHYRARPPLSLHVLSATGARVLAAASCASSMSAASPASAPSCASSALAASPSPMTCYPDEVTEKARAAARQVLSVLNRAKVPHAPPHIGRPQVEVARRALEPSLGAIDRVAGDRRLLKA